MKLSFEQLKQALVTGNYIAADDIDRSIAEAKKRHVSLETLLIQQELVTTDILGQAMAEYLKTPYAGDHVATTYDFVKKIPESDARALRIIMIAEDAHSVTIVTDDPHQEGLVEHVKPLLFAQKKTEKREKKFLFFFKKQETVQVDQSTPEKKIVVHYVLPAVLDRLFMHYENKSSAELEQMIASGEQAPAIIDHVFSQALGERVSDIHIEPSEERVIIRFRIDGVLIEKYNIPKKHYEAILNSIKIMAHLRIDEHASAQDGAIRHAHEGAKIDMRVSIAPVIDGEGIVIRILSEYLSGFSLTDLGLAERDQEILEKASKKPFGMILIVGPTGSGKTTTSYALLKLLNSPETNIITIEDPVEYKIPGINQIQVNVDTNLTFAKGLRSIVRQDPDIILVGEIRDQETAEIAVNSALTGHLLFSTFHANDAASAIPRLLEMNVEPFLLSSTLQVVVGQRLVRTLCTDCRLSETVSRVDTIKKFPQVEKYFSQKNITLYQAKGCNVCNHTGFKGRTAIFELIPVDEKLKELILTKPSSQQIWDLVKQSGVRKLFEDGIEKVIAGVTTLDELLRVAEPE